MSFLTKILGDENKNYFKKLQPTVDAINALEEQLRTLDDYALKDKTKEFKDRLAKGESLDNLLNEAFAVVREAARRNLGQRHFDVQLMGALFDI